MCRMCVSEPEMAKHIRLSRKKDHFIFAVESTGIIRPAELFKQAVMVKCFVSVHLCASVRRGCHCKMLCMCCVCAFCVLDHKIGGSSGSMLVQNKRPDPFLLTTNERKGERKRKMKRERMSGCMILHTFWLTPVFF